MPQGSEEGIGSYPGRSPDVVYIAGVHPRAFRIATDEDGDDVA